MKTEAPPNVLVEKVFIIINDIGDALYAFKKYDNALDFRRKLNGVDEEDNEQLGPYDIVDLDLQE